MIKSTITIVAVNPQKLDLETKNLLAGKINESTPVITHLLTGQANDPLFTISMEVLQGYNERYQLTGTSLFNQIKVDLDPNGKRIEYMNDMRASDYWREAVSAFTLCLDTFNSRDEVHILVITSITIANALLYLWPFVDMKRNLMLKNGYLALITKEEEYRSNIF